LPVGCGGELPLDRCPICHVRLDHFLVHLYIKRYRVRGTDRVMTRIFS
jgi:hypothetical protein